MNCSKVPVRTW